MVQLLLIQTECLKETPLRKKNTAVLCKIPFFSDSSLWNDLCDIPNTSVDEDALKAPRENDPRETRREFAIKMDVHRSTMIRRLSSIGKVNNLNERASYYNLKDRNKFYRYRFTMIIVSNTRRLNKVPYAHTLKLFFYSWGILLECDWNKRWHREASIFRTLNCSSYSSRWFLSLHFLYLSLSFLISEDR